MDYNIKQAGRLWHITWRIHQLCREKNWTQADLAHHAHVKPHQIRKVENAISIKKVDMDILYRIADALEVQVTELLKD